MDSLASHGFVRVNLQPGEKILLTCEYRSENKNENGMKPRPRNFNFIQIQ